ncbi:HEAT repeat domain-containing protein [Nostoc sp. FACHB-280]|nr:HEAT repeat domain-containing protein [Nostoc sp. FACHB-280]
MLKSQQEKATELRRKATEQGFEINVYVPLGLVERKQQQRRQQDEQQDREKVYELTEEVIVTTYEHGAFLREVIAQQPAEKNKHIAIIGEPGAGKTTLLSTIASFINDSTQDLPICISLGNLQGKTIEEYLLKQWLTEAMRLAKPHVAVTQKIEHQLIECFSTGRVWLLLDGVDEMGENSPVQALAKINRELIASLRQARVVLTCRLNVWDAKVSNPLIGFDTYKTQKFKLEQIDEFIQKWFERAGDLVKGKTLQAKLKETKHDNIRQLVRNPLCLSLLCQTFDVKQGELPKTKAALYKTFIRYLYEWKSELFPDLYDSDDLKDKLHLALSKLAFAGIDTKAGFRLTKKLARQQMTEKLFQLACGSFWLILVERTDEDDEEVYTFFHPNFQEYFAALAVDDWDLFLPRKHTDRPVKEKDERGEDKHYRIFESQWREVILLWLGREEENIKQQKQKFINALVNFKDGCGKWNSKNVDKGFYEYRAYFLAAVGIAEFREYSRADEIVAQILKWGFGYSTEKQNWVEFLRPISNEARAALLQTERIKAIKALEKQLQLKNLPNKSRRNYAAAESLWQIDPKNEQAINALAPFLLSKEAFGIGNEQVISDLMQLGQLKKEFDNTARQKVASTLEQFDANNRQAIDEEIDLLVQRLQSKNLEDDYIRWQIADGLVKIDPGNETAIATLVKLLESTTVDDFTRRYAAYSLRTITIGNKEAITALVKLLQSTTVSNSTHREAVESLGKIGIGNKEAIAALIKLLESTTVDDLTSWQAASSLGKIAIGNQEAIAALVKLLQSTTVNDYTRRYAADCLGKILQNNQDRSTVVKVLSNYWKLDGKYYDLAWQCAQNMPYPDFYQAWHPHNFAIRTMRSLKQILFTRII